MQELQFQDNLREVGYDRDLQGIGRVGQDLYAHEEVHNDDAREPGPVRIQAYTCGDFHQQGYGRDEVEDSQGAGRACPGAGAFSLYCRPEGGDRG